MSDSSGRLVIDNLSGGRNGFDPPHMVANNQSVDAVNVDFYRTYFGHKRGGMQSVSTSGATGTGIISSLIRHVPTTDQTLAELWKSDDAATPIIDRLAGGSTWATPTLKDAPTGNGWDLIGASINGKLALAYKSGVDRLHFWDGSTVRRGGLAMPIAAPTVANTGAGGTPAFDASASVVFSGTSFTHVCGAGATMLFVALRIVTGAVSAVTYNGVAMTLVASVVNTSTLSLYYLGNPSSGSHTVAITSSGSQGAVSTSYTGSASTIDTFTTNTTTGATITTTLTAGVDSAWMMYAVEDISGTGPTQGTNTTGRVGTGSLALLDSNLAITPIQPYPMSAGVTAGAAGTGILVSVGGLAPPLSAVPRQYRVRWTRQNAGVTIGRSEPSASVAFTPSGSGTAARITQPTVASEGETHWEVEAATDGITFYRIATVAIGTTTYDDAASTTAYSNSPLSALTGVYTLQKAYKFIAADQNRLLGLSSYTTTDKQSRLEISAVIGSSDIGDEERVDTSAVNSYIDFDENDSGVCTGLNGPIYGAFFLFKDRQTWQLTPTGNVEQPYQQSAISKTIGALSHLAITKGEDSAGNSALYWMSHRGPYRWTINGLEYLGRNVEDFTLTSVMLNLAATKSVSRVTYFADKRQVWYWWATGSSNDCNQGMIYDVINGGWSRIPTGDKLSNVRCAVMFSNTIGASMSLDLKPYVGYTGTANKLLKCDTGVSDDGTTFQAYQLTKAYEPGGAGFYGKVDDKLILAVAASGVTISDTVIGDFGAQASATAATADLTPVGSETRVQRRMAGGGFAGNTSFYQHQVGDAVASTSAWTIDRLIVPYSRQQAATR